MTTPSLHDEPVVARPNGSGSRDAGGPGALADAVAVLGSYFALGVVGAVLWWTLHDPALFTVSEGGGLGMGEVQLAKRFNADAWYAVIAAALGLLSGTALTWWRSRDPLLTGGLVLVGSGLAAAVMEVLGGWLGPADPRELAGAAEAGARLASALTVDSAACYLVWPVLALIGSLVVLWSPPPGD